MAQLGIKSRVFIYYLQNVSGNKMTNKFNIDFSNEEEKFAYYKMARTKLATKYGEVFINQFPNFVASEARKMLDNDACNARQWLIDNGYLFQNNYTKYDGQMVVRYIGVTQSGWKVAPKYLALV